jgi:hypothetical protein
MCASPMVDQEVPEILVLLICQTFVAEREEFGMLHRQFCLREA